MQKFDGQIKMPANCRQMTENEMMMFEGGNPAAKAIVAFVKKYWKKIVEYAGIDFVYRQGKKIIIRCVKKKKEFIVPIH